MYKTDHVVKTWKYSASSHYLKIFYIDGSAVLFYSVPTFVYDNMLRVQNKTDFIERYLTYNLHFSSVALA